MRPRSPPIAAWSRNTHPFWAAARPTSFTMDWGAAAWAGPTCTSGIAMLHASGAASTLQRRGIPHTRHSCGCASVPPDPTQLRAKAHFCDRHHIASAMAELMFCLSIIPHVRSFDVPPKLSPAHAGLFFAARLKRGHAIGMFGLSAFDDLDLSSELLVCLRQVRPVHPARVLGPLPVLPRSHQVS